MLGAGANPASLPCPRCKAQRANLHKEAWRTQYTLMEAIPDQGPVVRNELPVAARLG